MRNGGEMKVSMVIKLNKKPNNTKNNDKFEYICVSHGLKRLNNEFRVK